MAKESKWRYYSTRDGGVHFAIYKSYIYSVSRTIWKVAVAESKIALSIGEGHIEEHFDTFREAKQHVMERLERLNR